MDIELETAALRRLAGALAADPASADDLVQDTWVAALRSPPDEERPVRPWLATVLRNRHISLARSSRRARARHEQGTPQASPPSLEQIQVSKRLIEEVEAMPAADAELIIMRYWEGLSAAECAARLDIKASTARSRLQRALERLRERLDRGEGGRAAWMAALMPLVKAPPVSPTGAASTSVSTSTLNAKTLTVGGVAAATILWLAVALPHGCDVEGETASPAEATRVDAEAPAGPRPAPARLAATEPRDAVEAGPRDAPEPTPSPPDDTVDLQAYRSPTGPNGGVHPQLAVALAMRGVFDEVGTCHTLAGPGRARMTTFVRFEGDGTTTFEEIRFENVENFPEAERQCVRQTVAARELEVKKVDVTQAGFPPETTLAYSMRGDLTLEDGEAEIVTIHHAPLNGLYTKSGDLKGLQADVAACGDGVVAADLRYDQATLALAEVHATGTHAGTAQGRCIEAAVMKHVAPTWYFEPEGPRNDTLACRFGVAPEEAERRYTCIHQGPPDPTAPHPVDD